MKKIIIILVVVLVVMEWLGWWAYKLSKTEADSAKKVENVQTQPQAQQPIRIDNPLPSKQAESNDFNTDRQDSIETFDVSSFPPPVVEKINGEMQRTIHMGVRQWTWDPQELNVNYGEKVILIMHNADVEHSISIPDLNVKADIPEEGAIVKFTASKKGIFDFSCDLSEHRKMEGKIVIE